MVVTTSLWLKRQKRYIYKAAATHSDACHLTGAKTSRLVVCHISLALNCRVLAFILSTGRKRSDKKEVAREPKRLIDRSIVGFTPIDKDAKGLFSLAPGPHPHDVRKVRIIATDPAAAVNQPRRNCFNQNNATSSLSVSIPHTLTLSHNLPITLTASCTCTPSVIFFATLRRRLDDHGRAKPGERVRWHWDKTRPARRRIDSHRSRLTKVKDWTGLDTPRNSWP